MTFLTLMGPDKPPKIYKQPRQALEACGAPRRSWTGKLSLIAIIAISLTSAGLAEVRCGPFVEPPRSIRSRIFDQQHVRLELDCDLDRQEIRGRAVHTLKPFAPLQHIEFDAAEMKIEQVALADGPPSKKTEQRPAARKLKFTSGGGRLVVTLDRRYLPQETIRLAIDYRVSGPDRGAHFVVPDTTEPAQPRMLWTQSEPESARYWFPCFDSPTDRLTSEILVTAPKKYFVLSNGTLKGKRDREDGTRTWHWTQEQPHVTYLMSVVVGEFEAYRQQWDDIAIVSYVPKGRLADAARSFKKTPAMMQFFSEKIGYRYPWPKYAQICVDEFSAGGMEHTSATTLNARTLHDRRAQLDTSSDGLVAHELSHHWWGNLLTCKDWAELWLNESFATYFTTLWFEHDLGLDEATWKRYEEAEEYFREDKDRYRRPIVTYRYQRPGNMFDRHSYPKGGRVLHMLRFVLGDKAFWRALRHYCRKHAFGTVETADLRTAIEESTGQGLNWFFDQWVYHGGHPEYHFSYEWDEGQKSAQIVVEQTQEVDDLTPLFRMPIEIEIVTAEETTVRKITVSKAKETFHFSLKQRPRRICFDPRDWLLKMLTVEKSKQEWLDQAENDVYMICRFRAVRQLAEFSKDRDVAAALARVLHGERFWAVRQEAARSLGKFHGDEVREALLGAALNDPKSFVRREAVKTLADFSHDDVRHALREIIEQDRSCYAIAEALRTLVQVDRAGYRDDLLSAMQQRSHREVILRAAAEGLADLDDRPPSRRRPALGTHCRLRSLG